MINNIMSSFNDDSDDDSNIISDKMKQEYLYVKSSIDATSLISNFEYDKAIELYKQCKQIAEAKCDSYKINETNVNISIALMMKGKIKESISIIEPIYNTMTSSSIISSDTINGAFLRLKTMSNYLIISLILKPTIVIDVINNIIAFISHESDIKKRKKYLYYVNYILFRTKSLINDSNIESPNIINRIMKGFNDYLRNNDITKWIDILVNVAEEMKNKNDYCGIIFSLFNHEAAIYLRETSSSEASEARLKLIALMKAMENDNDNIDNVDYDRNVDMILTSYKNKMNICYHVYQLLYSYEKTINSEIENASTMTTSSTEYFVKILLNYAIRYIENNISEDIIQSQLKSHIAKTLDLIETKQIDVSDINLSSLSPSISNSLHILIDNIAFILERNYKRNVFDKYKSTVKKLSQLELARKIKNYLEEHYLMVTKGDAITKVNMTSNGSLVHFYQLNYDEDKLIVYKKASAKKIEKTVVIDDIVKIMIGIRTKNLIKKTKNLKYKNEPWLYMSIILKDRSIDFEFDDENIIKRWFYGLYHFLYRSKRVYKIASCSSFIIERLRLKLLLKSDLIPSSTSSVSFISSLNKYNRTNKL